MNTFGVFPPTQEDLRKLNCMPGHSTPLDIEILLRFLEIKKIAIIVKSFRFERAERQKHLVHGKVEVGFEVAPQRLRRGLNRVTNFCHFFPSPKKHIVSVYVWDRAEFSDFQKTFLFPLRIFKTLIFISTLKILNENTTDRDFFCWWRGRGVRAASDDYDAVIK